MIEHIVINTIEYLERAYFLSKSLTISVYDEGGLWVYQNEEYDLCGWHKDKDMALVAFCEDFDFAYKEFAEEEDDKLHSSAQEYKRELLKLVDQIQYKDL